MHKRDLKSQNIFVNIENTFLQCSYTEWGNFYQDIYAASHKGVQGVRFVVLRAWDKKNIYTSADQCGGVTVRLLPISNLLCLHRKYFGTYWVITVAHLSFILSINLVRLRVEQIGAWGIFNTQYHLKIRFQNKHVI